MPITSTSLCPVPTVSTKTTSLPAASRSEQRLQRRLGETAEVAARAHRADEDAGVEEVVGEPDAVAEQRALRERARRVDGDDADRRCPRADEPYERGDEARLADAGRAGDADRVRVAGPRIELAHDAVRERVAVLDERDRARERAPVARADAGRKCLARPVAASGHRGATLLSAPNRRRTMAGTNAKRSGRPEEACGPAVRHDRTRRQPNRRKPKRPPVLPAGAPRSGTSNG